MGDIGEPIRKVDHYEKVCGEAKYIDDYCFDGMLYAAMVRSSRPHARILSVE